MASILKKADIGDADNCVKLLYISDSHLYSYMFVEKEPRIYDFLKLLYNIPGIFYSKEYITIEEENNRQRGMLLAFPARDMNIIAKNMLRHLGDMFKKLGFFSFFKMLFRLTINIYFVTEKDEFFISNIAVFEEYRGKGVAKKLLIKAEEIAVEQGLNKLSLYVDFENTHAKNVYEKFGFKEDENIVLSKKYHKHNLTGFYKMIKVIGEK